MRGEMAIQNRKSAEMLQISELATTTLKGQVVERIRHAILSGAFKPGDRLNESHLADQFKVSRIPVREALLKLQERGLVTNHPRRGMFVTVLDEEDVQRINSLRIVLESEAIKLCRIGLTSTLEQRLRAIVNQMDGARNMSDFEASALDLQFHKTIWQGSGNPYLEKALTSLVTVLFAHQAITYTTAKTGLHWPLHHHRTLLKVILGDIKVTPEAAMTEHLRLRYGNPERWSSLGLSD